MNYKYLILINPLAPFFAKTKYLENICYYTEKYNDYFRECILNEIKLNDTLIKILSDRLIDLSSISLAEFFEKAKLKLNFNIELNNIRILPEYLIVFENEGVNPFLINADGSYLLYANDEEVDLLDKNEVIYDIIGFKSNKMRVTRSGVILEFCQYLRK